MMKVFMLGWEFPPFISGGLGTACYGLTRGLDRHGVEVVFVLPRAIQNAEGSHVRIVSPAGVPEEDLADATAFELEGLFEHVQFRAVDAVLAPYARPDRPDATPGSDVTVRGAGERTTAEQFDVIHAHDWMTYPAGIAAARAEWQAADRARALDGVRPLGRAREPAVYDIERAGMHAATSA
jgi:glycogen(starch) synthase